MTFCSDASARWRNSPLRSLVLSTVRQNAGCSIPCPSRSLVCRQHLNQNVRWVTPYPAREVSDARRYQTRGAEGVREGGGGGRAGG